MRRLRGSAAAAAVAALLAGVPAWAESMADSMVGAYRHSALLDQNRALLRAADEDVASAMAALRPVAQWAASHNFQRSDGVEVVSDTIQVVAQMTLYDWGRGQLAIDIAKEQVLSTREALIAVEQDVLLQAIQAFLQVGAAERQVALNRNSVDVLGRERQAAQDRFDVGEITTTDVALAEAQLAATRAGLAAAQGQLEIARETYKSVVGREPKSLDPPPALPKRPKSLEAARATAVKTHPAVRQARRAAAAAELGVAAAAAERRPRVTGSVSLGATRQPERSLFGTGGPETTATLGASVEASQTIYSGGRLPAAHRKAMAQRDAARSALLNASRQVSEAVGRAWANIDVARAQIGAIDEQISAARQAYEGVREEATLGARTTLDVLDAEQNLLQAQADKITAEANLQLAHYQLLAAMGVLTVKDLKLGIPTYDPSAYYNAVREAPYTSTQGQNLDRVLRGIGREPKPRN